MKEQGRKLDWYDDADIIISMADKINAIESTNSVCESDLGKKFVKGVGAAVLAGTVAANSPAHNDSRNSPNIVATREVSGKPVPDKTSVTNKTSGLSKPNNEERSSETIQDSCNGNPQLNKFYDNANIDIKECEVTKETVMNAIDNGFLHEQGVAVQRPNIRYVKEFSKHTINGQMVENWTRTTDWGQIYDNVASFAVDTGVDGDKPKITYPNANMEMHIKPIQDNDKMVLVEAHEYKHVVVKSVLYNILYFVAYDMIAHYGKYNLNGNPSKQMVAKKLKDWNVSHPELMEAMTGIEGSLDCTENETTLGKHCYSVSVRVNELYKKYFTELFNE